MSSIRTYGPLSWVVKGKRHRLGGVLLSLLYFHRSGLGGVIWQVSSLAWFWFPIWELPHPSFARMGHPAWFPQKPTCRESGRRRDELVNFASVQELSCRRKWINRTPLTGIRPCLKNELRSHSNRVPYAAISIRHHSLNSAWCVSNKPTDDAASCHKTVAVRS